MTTSFIAADIASWVCRSADPGGAARPLALAASRRSTSASTSASSAPSRSRAGPMRKARISDGYRLATSALTTRWATPVAKRCSAAPLCGVPSPGWCAGSAVPGAQVRAHQQRIDDAGGGAGIGEALVAARRHARERERGAAEHAREGRDLLDVGGRVAPDPLGIAAVDLVDPVAADVLAIGPGDAEVPRDRFQSVIGQVAGGEVVAQDGVQRVDQLAAGRDEADAARAHRRRRAMPRRAARCRRPGGPMRPSASGTPSMRARAIEERQVEAVQVVVLDDVRDRPPATAGDEPRDQVGLGRVAVAVRLEDSAAPVGSRTAIMKMRSRVGIEAGGLEIELHPVQVVEREIAEVGPAGRDQVLLFEGQREHRGLAEVA